MKPVPFQSALDALLNPLGFVARTGNAELVSDFDATVHAAAERLREFAVPSDVREALGRVAARFKEPLEPEARRAAVADALEWLAPLRHEDFPDQALARSVATLPGVGPKRAETLSKRGLGKMVDLLFHLPSRYDDRRVLQKIGELKVGTRGTFVGEVLVADHISIRPRGRGRGQRMFQAVIGDGSGTLNLKWFRGGDSRT